MNLKFKQIQKEGEDNVSRNRKQNIIRWEDLESAFSNRIRTGNIINLIQEDLRNFLNDVKSKSLMVEGRLKNIFKKGKV